MEDYSFISDTSRPSDKRPTPRFRSAVTLDERGTTLPTVEEAEKDLTGYDTEANRSKAVITIVESKRDQLSLSSPRARYRASLSPVHIIPPEILAGIFEECCTVRMSLHPSIPPPPVVLSAVCNHWREVALSTAALWSLIKIRMGHWPNAKQRKLLRATQMFISRSKRHPLAILFHSAALSDNHAFAPDVMDLLVKSCDRWHDVSLTLSSGSTRHPVFRNI